MKPNFEKMNKTQLRTYVLEHREDREALRALMSRRHPNAVKYDFPNTEEGREQTKAVIKRKMIRKNWAAITATQTIYLWSTTHR